MVFRSLSEGVFCDLGALREPIRGSFRRNFLLKWRLKREKAEPSILRDPTVFLHGFRVSRVPEIFKKCSKKVCGNLLGFLCIEKQSRDRFSVIWGFLWRSIWVPKYPNKVYKYGYIFGNGVGTVTKSVLGLIWGPFWCVVRMVSEPFSCHVGVLCLQVSF